MADNALYRIRIYGAGEDGTTPPRNEQTVLAELAVEAYEGVWVDGATPCLYVRGGAPLCGAYHGAPRGGVMMIETAGDDDAARLACEVDAYRRAHGGLRVEWERATAA